MKYSNKEEEEMKFKAWFTNELGQTFSKEFACGNDLEQFIDRVHTNKTATLIAFVSI